MNPEEKLEKYEQMVKHLYKEMEMDPEVLLERQLESLGGISDDLLMVYYFEIVNVLRDRGIVEVSSGEFDKL